MKVRCEGGMLDGQEFDKDQPEEVLHQSGMFVIRVHRPYPKKKGTKITEYLQTYWEHYDLTITSEGPVYRCRHPFTGSVMVGDAKLTRSADGAYDVYVDASGRMHAHPLETA